MLRLDHRNELKELKSELNLLSQHGSQARNGSPDLLGPHFKAFGPLRRPVVDLSGL